MRQSKKCTSAAVLVILLFLFSRFPTVALAASHDIASGSITINDNNSYTIFGTSSGAEVIVVTGGSPTITISDLTIQATTAPAIDIQAGEVTLILEDFSTLGGGTAANGVGQAGIRVAEGATLIIEAIGDGGVASAGGQGTNNKSAGAGIGSNGGESSFGTIIINDGFVTAAGNGPLVPTVMTPAASAGIGTGGTVGFYIAPMTGTIVVNGGIVVATGGQGNSVAQSLGGAGIGSGGNFDGADSLIEITINGGQVMGKGGMDAAGIGGGANILSGPIFIGGTSLVLALGSGSGGASGGAGIGGGNTGWTNGITITDNSNVTAIGGGAAAGIGGGYAEGNFGGAFGGVGIMISGNASVVAVGGSASASGGAGIGSGAIPNNSGSLGGIIKILDQANVEAYGGTGANAIGNGFITASNAMADPANISISNSASLKAFTADAAQPALNENTTIGTPAVLYSYTGTPIAAGIINGTGVTTPSGNLKWSWRAEASPRITVTDGTTFRADGDYQTTIFNWAFLAGGIKEAPVITSANNTTFNEGTANSFQETATNSPTSYAVAGTLPAGVTFDTTTGILSGTPAAGTAGTYPLMLTAMNSAGTSEPQSFTLTVQKTAVLYTIAASAGEHGIISPVGNTQVADGSSQTYTISADSGYVINTLIVDGIAVTATSSFTFVDVHENHSIVVTFKLAGTSTPVAPKTGDSGNFVWWSMLGAASVLSGFCVLTYKKRKIEHN